MLREHIFEKKCETDKFDFYAKDKVKIHKKYQLKLCLQCDDTIKNMILSRTRRFL